MKKISLILLGVFGLLFSNSVYADCLDPSICDITIQTLPFENAVFSNSVYTSDNSFTGVDFFKEYYTISNWDFTYDETGFGHYSDGTVIPSYRFHVGQNNYPMRWYKRVDSYTDPNGNVEIYLDIDNSRRIDFSRGWTPTYHSLAGVLSLRFDFAIHLDFYDSNGSHINNNISKSIFNGIWFEMAYDNAITCNTEYDDSIYNINVTCHGMLPKTLKYAIIFNNIGDKTFLHKDTQNYNYRAEIGFSLATMKTSPTGRIEDLIMDNSPNGDTFNDYFKKVELQSNSYFDRFNSFNFEGLSNVILAPLSFVRSLSSSSFDTIYRPRVNPYSCARDPLAVIPNLFNHQICIPSGAIFWNRGDLKSGSTFVSNFRVFWNILFGGFIIYLLSIKLFRVCLDSIDPHKERIESL